jgi:hypothetical protein
VSTQRLKSSRNGVGSELLYAWRRCMKCFFLQTQAIYNKTIVTSETVFLPNWQHLQIWSKIAFWNQITLMESDNLASSCQKHWIFGF